jgi:membrane associated rhomboid family serine protease
MNPYTNPFVDIKRLFRSNSVLSTLILINGGVWLLTKVIGVFFFLYNVPDGNSSSNWLLHILALPAFTDDLIVKPWSLITYMFFHLDFLHLLFNMLWLYWFGRIFLEYLTSRQLLITYFIGGIAGGLFYILAYNIFPVFHEQIGKSLALGASASVMAIVMAISFYVPNYSIQLLLLGRVKILYLALFLFIFDFFSIPSGNSGGHLAHIGGALWGLAYVAVLKRGFSLRSMNSSGNWIEKFERLFKKNKTSQNTPFSNYSRPKSDEEYNTEKLENQKKTDKILEKISKGGYDSLTKEEKAFLFRSSGKKN